MFVYKFLFGPVFLALLGIYLVTSYNWFLSFCILFSPQILLNEYVKFLL